MSDTVLSVIPARGGSKGVPRKNLRELGDKPLVAHAISTCAQSELVDRVVLTTDSRDIAQIGHQYGVDRVIDRPAELAADDVPLAPVVNHAYETLDETYSHVLCLQPTTPLISSGSIDDGIRAGFEADAESLIFVRDSTHHYWKAGDEGYEPVSSDRENRQLMDPIYEEIGVFLTHGDLVADGLRVGSEPAFHEVPDHEGIDVDSYADWLLAESHLGRKQLVYRVTGNSESGTGHVFRGITIADHLFEHDVLFAVNQRDGLAIEKLDESNYDYRVFDDDAAFVRFVESSRPDVVVNDILDTTGEYVQRLGATGTRVVNFEDLGGGADHADAVINALYEYSTPPANHYFGYEYFCLRNEFRYATPHSEIPSVDRIMISFGGTDENNLTAKTLRALAALETDVHLDVVLGLGYEKAATLDPILDDYPPNVTVTVNENVRSMAERMERADLLITSNGRTLYEAGSLNLPVVSIAQNQREQKHPYAHVSRGVLMLGQSDYVTEANVLAAVEDYVADDEKREGMRAALANHDITNGIDRIKGIIFEETDDE